MRYVKDEVFISHTGEPFEIFTGPAEATNGSGLYEVASTGEMLLRAIDSFVPIPQMGRILSYEQVIQLNRVRRTLEGDSVNGYYLLEIVDSDVAIQVIKWSISIMMPSWQMQAELLVGLIEKAPLELPVHENA